MARVVEVLIVEDQKLFAELLEHVLSEADDIRVVGAAGTVSEAHAILSETYPDVLILDLRLPDGSGLEVAEVARRSHPEARILMLTALDDEAVHLSAIQAGCAGFLTKEHGVGDVVNAVRRVSAGETLIGPEMLARVVDLASRRPETGPLTRLSERETEVLAHAAQGKTNREIGLALHLSEKTVRNHMQRILGKLDARSKLEAVAVAARRGILTLHA